MITNNNEQNNYLTTKSKFIEIVCEKEKVLINLNEVMYIERDARKVRFVTKGSEYASYSFCLQIAFRRPLLEIRALVLAPEPRLGEVELLHGEPFAVVGLADHIAARVHDE